MTSEILKAINRVANPRILPNDPKERRDMLANIRVARINEGATEATQTEKDEAQITADTEISLKALGEKELNTQTAKAKSIKDRLSKQFEYENNIIHRRTFK